MTGPFLPRPSPDHHAFECDSNGHLRGQDVRLLINYADQEGYGREGGGYISRQGARKLGEDAGVLISNQNLSYPRAANARPKSPSLVSCFIPFNIHCTASPATIGGSSPSFMLFFVFVTHSLLFKGCPLDDALVLSNAQFFFTSSTCQVFLCYILFSFFGLFINNVERSLSIHNYLCASNHYHISAQVR